MNVPAGILQIIVLAIELAQKYLPGVIQVGENLVHAIKSHGDLTTEEKDALIARVKATRAEVAAYKPIPPPKPTRPG